jgi:hypothetical protein
LKCVDWNESSGHASRKYFYLNLLLNTEILAINYTCSVNLSNEITGYNLYMITWIVVESSGLMSRVK